LLHALDALPVDYRMSVILVALQGLSHAEAAVVQKVSEGTISWRIHEARGRLQRAMADGAYRHSHSKTRALSGDLSQALSDNGLPGLLGSLQLVN
jgi:RNA polymerase sigma-70 factor (ECF subfamily)